VTVNVGATATSPQVNTAAVSGGGSATPPSANDSTVIIAVPVLTVTSSHSGSFTQGQQSATYTVTVSNASGAAPTSGTVTVTENLPSGLTLVSMAGTGWTCPAGGAACTTGNALNGGSSYPAITVTVNVGGNAASPQLNSVAVSGGGSAPASAADSTTIISPALSITSSHAGSFTQGQQGMYTLTVSNASGAASTSGTVTATENLPSGLTLVSMAGTGWTCPTGGSTCTTSNVLTGGNSYSTITVTVAVGTAATSPQTNSVTVSGGGSASASASDSTTIVSPTYIFTIMPNPTSNPNNQIYYQTVQMGGTATYTVLPPPGYIGTIELNTVTASCGVSDPNGPPVDGLTAPSTVNADGSTTVTIGQDATFPGAQCVSYSSEHGYMILTVYVNVVGVNPKVYGQNLVVYLQVLTTPYISLAASLLSKTATTATYLATVSTQSFQGSVSVTPSGSCASLIGPTPSIQLPGGQRTQSATVLVSTATCPAGSNQNITFSASGTPSGGGAAVNADQQTVPLQTAPTTAAVMTNPPPGATIAGGQTSFVWSAVPGASYSLAVGSSVGGTDIYSSATSSTNASPTLPTTGAVYATLGTQVSGVWQYQQYAYVVNPSPPAQTLTVTAGPASATVGNNGTEFQYTYTLTGGDATLLSKVNTSLAGAGVMSRIVRQSTSQVVIGLTAPKGLAAQPMTVVFCDPNDPDGCPVPCDPNDPNCIQPGGGGGVQDIGITVSPTTVIAGTATMFTLSWDEGSDITITGVSLLGSPGVWSQSGDSATVTFDIGLNPAGCVQDAMDIQGTYLLGNGSGTSTFDQYAEICEDAAPTVTLSPAVAITGVGTELTLAAEIQGAPEEWGSVWTIDNGGVASIPRSCSNQTTCTLTAGGTGGTATVTFTITDGAGNPIGSATAPLKVVEVTLTSITWTQPNSDVMYKQSSTQPWTSDTLAADGQVLVGWAPDAKGKLQPAPVWTCCGSNGYSPTLMDPVVYQTGASASFGPLTFSIYPQLSAADLAAMQATLTVTSDQASLAFSPNMGLQLEALDSDGNYAWNYGAASTGLMPGGIANFDANLTFSIAWSAGGQSVIATAAQTFLVTLGPPAGFVGGTNSNVGYSFPPSNVKASRVDYVTRNLSGSTASNLMAALKSYLVTGQAPIFTGGSNSIGDAWTALDNPAQYPLIDCASLAWIAAVMLEHAGVNAGFAYALATSDTDATNLEQGNQTNGLPMLLYWYLSQGKSAPPQKFEAYVYLCTGTVASEAHTLEPPLGPIYPVGTLLPPDACPAEGVGTMKGLALAVMARTLQGQQVNPIDTTYGGLQWWVDATTKGPVPAANGGGHVPFPVANLGVN
jgi:uncharacterized repeat protein (TIGR01451 family)